MELTIRPATEDDAAAMVELLTPIVRAGAWTIMTDPPSLASQLDFIRGLPARSVLNVAETPDGRLVGLQDVQPCSPEPALRHVGDIGTFVALDASRRGVGRRLCSATLAEAAARGYRKIMATIRADNGPALAFYRSQGFAVVGTARRHAFVGGRYVDEVITERQLDDVAGPAPEHDGGG